MPALPSHLLLFSAGTSDLQAVKDGEQFRTCFDTRASHRRLIEVAECLRWVETSEAHERFLRLIESKSPRDTAGTGEDFFGRIFNSLSNHKIYAPKLLPVLFKLNEEGLVPNVLALNTNRNSSEPKEEPIACGPLLAALADRVLHGSTLISAPVFVESKLCRASYIDVFTGKENYAHDDCRLAGIKRVQDALCAYQKAGVTDVTIADTGGLPGMKHAVQLVAQLVFGDDHVRVVRVSERRDQPGPNVLLQQAPLTLTPDMQLQFRITIDRMLATGEIDSAHALCTVNKIRGGWVDSVRVAHDLLAGFGRKWSEAAVRCKDTVWPLNNHADVEPPAIAAFRVEAALRRGAFPQALTLTCEFNEWLFMLAVENFLRHVIPAAIRGSFVQFALGPDKMIECVDPAGAAYALAHTLELREVQGDHGVKLFLAQTGKYPPPLLNLRTRNGVSELGIDNGKNAKRVWLEKLKLRDLQALHQAIDVRDGAALAPSEFRNAQTHNGYADRNSRYSMQMAIKLLVERELWSTNCTHLSRSIESGALFLDQPLIKNSMAEVCSHEAFKNTKQVYGDWIDRLRQQVRQGV